MFTYDPTKVTLVIAGNTISHFVKGSFVECSRDEDLWTKTPGADGKTARTRNANKGGSVKITLMQISPSNDVLSAQAALDEASGAGVGEVQVTDTTSLTSLVHGANAWVKKIADLKRGAEISEVEWMIDCDELDIFVGGGSTSP